MSTRKTNIVSRSFGQAAIISRLPRFCPEIRSLCREFPKFGYCARTSLAAASVMANGVFAMVTFLNSLRAARHFGVLFKRFRRGDYQGAFERAESAITLAVKGEHLEDGIARALQHAVEAVRKTDSESLRARLMRLCERKGSNFPRDNPKVSESLRRAAMIASNHDGFDCASAYLKLAVELDSGNEENWFLLGYFLIDSDRVMAKECMQRAVDLQPAIRSRLDEDQRCRVAFKDEFRRQ